MNKDKTDPSDIPDAQGDEVSFNKTFFDLIEDTSATEFKLCFSEIADIQEFVHELRESGIDMSGEVILSPPLSDGLSNASQDMFPVESYIGQLVGEVDLDFYVYKDRKLPTLLITPDEAYYRVQFGDVEEIVEISGSRFHGALGSEFDSLLIQSDKLKIDVPPWDELLSGLADETSEETANEFEDLVDELSQKGSINKVSAAILAGARSGELLYDLSKWGEDAGIGSKATFSRRKNNLEDRGIIATESVPVEIGRPRKRLIIESEPDDIEDILLSNH